MQTADGVIERGGVTDCDASRARRIRDWAIRHLELILPDPDPIAAEYCDGIATRDRNSRPRLRGGGPAKVGLIGWNTATGLGAMNRDLVRRGLVDRWLVFGHPGFATLPVPETICQIDSVPYNPDYDLSPWLDGLDWLLFLEHPYVKDCTRQAHDHRVRVAFIPMWELANPRHDWLPLIDLVICPHLWCYRVFKDWKSRYDAGWDVVHIPWPVDFHRLPYRQRQRCRRFLFINGTGGCRAVSLQNGSASPRRKGIDLVLDAAALVPSASFLVYTQRPLTRACPPNVELRSERSGRAELYREGDVCLQPSHWEGLGLQMLECQAAGIPLVTTDAPPMNEYKPLRVVPVHQRDVVSIADFHPFTANFMKAEDLAAILQEIQGADVSGASRAAREFIERERGWDRALDSFRKLLIS
jgi:glycosyltransferase involved in cell wall biosynthesis